MVDEELGSGPAVDENLDFKISPTGDIETTTGREELSKDLSFNMLIELRDYVGSPSSPNVITNVERDARVTALADERVTEVKEINAEIDNRYDLSLDMTVVVESGTEYDLVFDI